ncbi:MAG: hypothetical protein R3305_05855, partial [Gammaproteobacteria bacterium]|nr:hypothetical protein [Gammaproteobacteria bacterium]
VTRGSVAREVRDPRENGLARCKEQDLAGAEPEDNAKRLRAALDGKDTAAHRDALIIGAALALEVTGAEPDFVRAIERARFAIDDGAGARLLDELDLFVADELSTEGGSLP